VKQYFQGKKSSADWKKLLVTSNSDFKIGRSLKKPEVKDFSTNRDLARIIPQKADLKNEGKTK